MWKLYVELTKNSSSHSQLSYKVEKKKKTQNGIKRLTLTGNDAEEEHTEEGQLSRTYHLIMSIFFFVSFCRFLKNFGSN